MTYNCCRKNIECMQCGKTFNIIKSRKTAKFCSRSCANSYNKSGNKYCVGRILSKETKDKIGKAQIGRIQTQEERKKKSIASKKTWERLKETQFYIDKVNEMKNGKALLMRKKARFNKESSLEKYVENQLLFHNILYIKQYVYKLGIADFWLPEINMIIEVDGDYWHNRPEVKERDNRQTKWLEENDYTVIRIPGHDIKNCMNYVEVDE